jgi:hypothetical protein
MALASGGTSATLTPTFIAISMRRKKAATERA